MREASRLGVPFRSVWTLDRLHEVVTRLQRQNGGPELSRASMIRILNDAEMRPHRMRLWLHSPDPRFRDKVTEICALYVAPPSVRTAR